MLPRLCLFISLFSCFCSRSAFGARFFRGENNKYWLLCSSAQQIFFFSLSIGEWDSDTRIVCKCTQPNGGHCYRFIINYMFKTRSIVHLNKHQIFIPIVIGFVSIALVYLLWNREQYSHFLAAAAAVFLSHHHTYIVVCNAYKLKLQPNILRENDDFVDAARARMCLCILFDSC